MTNAHSLKMVARLERVLMDINSSKEKCIFRDYIAFIFKTNRAFRSHIYFG